MIPAPETTPQAAPAQTTVEQAPPVQAASASVATTLQHPAGTTLITCHANADFDAFAAMLVKAPRSSSEKPGFADLWLFLAGVTLLTAFKNRSQSSSETSATSVVPADAITRLPLPCPWCVGLRSLLPFFCFSGNFFALSARNGFAPKASASDITAPLIRYANKKSRSTGRGFSSKTGAALIEPQAPGPSARQEQREPQEPGSLPLRA